MKRIIIFICVCIMPGFGLSSQEVSEENKKTHEFGAHAGATSGVGLSYRYWPQKLGIQITLVPIKTDEFTFVSMGLTGLYDFYETRSLRFFGYFGNHIYFNEYVEYTYNLNGSDIKENIKRNAYNFGFGPGFGFGKRIRFNLMVGYGFYDVFHKFNMYPTGELGLYFRY